MAETITVEMIIHDVVSMHPATVKVFHGHGLPCTACAVGSRESIAGGARTHRFAPEKLALLLQDLNAAANGQPTSVAPKKLLLAGVFLYRCPMPTRTVASNRSSPL